MDYNQATRYLISLGNEVRASTADGVAAAKLGLENITALLDELGNPQNLQIKLWNNGVLMQDYNTNDMANDIPHCIEWISSIHALEPGDILALGTNHRGLSAIQDGDRIELEVDGLGRLHVNIRDDLKRTWVRGTRLQLAEKGITGRPKQLSGKYSNPGS